MRIDDTPEKFSSKVYLAASQLKERGRVIDKALKVSVFVNGLPKSFDTWRTLLYTQGEEQLEWDNILQRAQAYFNEVILKSQAQDYLPLIW